MQTIHIEPDLDLPFEIRSDPAKRKPDKQTMIEQIIQELKDQLVICWLAATGIQLWILWMIVEAMR